MRAVPADGRPLLQIAPMMEVTYRDFRYFMRLLTKRAQLWTEMVVGDTLLHNPAHDRFLGFHPSEHPVVCQLGGCEPEKLAETAKVVEQFGYDEVNLNVGCPSHRVASEREFGCALMKRKELVRDIVHAMGRAVQIPVTVKCRLGVDDLDSPQFTSDFVRTVAQGGCKHFIIHARKAWLKGLSPSQNRSVPPLHYHRVLELCKEFPDLSFSLNGGVNTVGHARALLGFPGERLPGETEELASSAWGWAAAQRGCELGELPGNFQGVMIGRGAMNTPTMLWDVDRSIYGDPAPSTAMTRRRLLDSYCEYLEEVHPPGEPRPTGVVHLAVKPTLALFSGMRGNKVYRNALDAKMRDEACRTAGPAHVLSEAIRAIEEFNPGVLDEPLGQTAVFTPALGGSPEKQSAGEVNPAAQRGRKRKADDVVDPPPVAGAAASGEPASAEGASKAARAPEQASSPTRPTACEREAAPAEPDTPVLAPLHAQPVEAVRGVPCN